MSYVTSQDMGIGVFYLARGADVDALRKFEIFKDSYSRWQAGAGHQLCVIFKGFRNASELALARNVFDGIEYRAIYVEDEGFDLGAYFSAASRVEYSSLCFLNTASRICGSNWLLKLAANLAQPGVGMVSCTASYEAPQHPGERNIPFPNPHLRSNAFMIQRDHFLALRPLHPLVDKMDAYRLEHGPNSMSRRITSLGLKVLLVGKNGRGYTPATWPQSRTFRQGDQSNLLVADNQTDGFENAPVPEKRFLFQLCWGDAGTRASAQAVVDALQQIERKDTDRSVGARREGLPALRFESGEFQGVGDQ